MGLNEGIVDGDNVNIIVLITVSIALFMWSEEVSSMPETSLGTKSRRA